MKKKGAASKAMMKAAAPASTMKAVKKFPALKLANKLKFRQLKVVRVPDLKGGALPKSLKEKYKDTKFKIRKSVTEDAKGSKHGDNYILKKMFADRPYESAHNRFQKDPNLPSKLKGVDLFANRNVLDLGANIGTFTVQAAVNGAKSVLAYEPDPETFRQLKLNIELNGKNSICSAVQAGASADGKTASIYTKVRKNMLENAGDLDYRPDRANRNSLISDCVNPVATGEQVKTEKLGGIVRKFRPELVKCDIEGMELGIFDDLANKTESNKCGSDLSSVQELMVYYHVDKWPKLRDFEQFLTNLKKLFPFVQPVWTSKIPDPEKKWDWRKELKTNPELEGRSKEELGPAAKQMDILVYCAK
mmetsp:Transcript_9210/g.27258  ORF Transcript_9210/g.27258 Transcript_9210/m.27258 type:complete len:361 (+) Transcript_9210:76-1158(+)